MLYNKQGGGNLLLTPKGNLYSSPILDSGPRLNTKPQQVYSQPTGRSISDLSNRGQVSFNPVRNGIFPNGTGISRDRNVSAPVSSRPAIDEIAGGSLGILGGAAILAPAVAPVAAAAGIGYGAYKLGQSFKLW